jgi:hypothetical protein
MASCCILINFDHHGDRVAVHVLAEDAKTPISSRTNVASESALLKLLAYYGCVDMKWAKWSLRHGAELAHGASRHRFEGWTMSAAAAEPFPQY